MIPVDRTTVLLSIRPVYADRILAGTKTIEFRRKPLPEQVETVLIWRTGKGGGIVGKFHLRAQRQDFAHWFAVEQPDGTLFTSSALGIDGADLIAYAGGRDAKIWALGIEAKSTFPQTIDAKAIHPSLHRPPQSWRYAPEGWAAAIDEALGVTA